MRKSSAIIIGFLILNGCNVGPDYVRPETMVPIEYKEAPPEGWKMAQPQDDCERGPWWEVFNDPVLNELISQVEVFNQNIQVAQAQYHQAQALVAQARANYYPVVTTNASVSRKKTPTFNNLNQESNSNSDFGDNVSNEYLVTASTTWEPDLWGSVRRLVEANKAARDASHAQLELTTLLMQTSLAQTYFQLRGLDGDQRVFDETVNNYQKLYKITYNRYQVGVASKGDVLQVQSLLEQAQANAIDNRINRAIYEHAIAVLIGEVPANFTLPPCDKIYPVDYIPIEIPSALLERRPDIAQAERQVAQANAQIGVAMAAYFPVLTLTGDYGYDTNQFLKLFSGPASLWSIGAQLAQTVFDGGARKANVQIATANYDATVANYRQVVLAAFQNVEDNLATLRILNQELVVQEASLKTAEQALNIITNEYKAGTAALADILNAEITTFNAKKGVNDVRYRRLYAAVGLINALGGDYPTEE